MINNNFIKNEFLKRDKAKKTRRRYQRNSTKKYLPAFLNHLFLRAASKPAPYIPEMELMRRILQLHLLMYRNPLQGNTIKSVASQLYRRRNGIKVLLKTLNDKNISEVQFIKFCYWFIQKYPMKFYHVLKWILYNAILDMKKIESAEPSIWQIVDTMMNASERSQKLLRLIIESPFEKKQKTDEVYEQLKNI